MLKLSKYIAFFTILSLFSPFNATTLEEVQQKYMEIIMECSKEFPLTVEHIEQLKDKQMPDSDDVKCLFACTYKKTGMMDNQGMLSVDGVNNLAKKYFSNDQDKLTKAQEFTDVCANVNDVSVNDGDKGCERAALIYKCSIEQAPQFGFV